MAKKNKKRNAPPPPPPSLHPILNVLPAATRSDVSSSLSQEEMQVLTNMIIVVTVMDCFDPIPSSRKAKEDLERFPGNSGAHKSAAFGCQFFPCYRSFWERWASTSSSNRRRIDVAVEAFKNSLTSWRKANANSMEDSSNSRMKDERGSGVSLPALEEVVEERSDEVEQETHRSFAGNVLAILLNFFDFRAWRLWSTKG